ncbi:MAG TPA: hypothetical protein VK742_15480 [Candidatus Sulfotelmatobacter sp.]|jgi:hypothetical protein|nr:hypothetical protein [Candidatus Sulfotelmatobacter sp.]
MNSQTPNVSRDGLRAAARGLDGFLNRIDSWGLAQKNIMILTVLLAIFAIMTALPNYRHFHYGGEEFGTAVMQWKFDHPLQPVPVKEMAVQMHEDREGVISHMEKMSYRVFVPLVAHVLGLSPTTALALQQVLACLFLLLVLAITREIFQDKLSALLAAMMVAVSFPGQWGFSDFFFYDGYAYFLIALAVWTTSPLVAAAAILAGGLTDERAILTAPLIWLWIGLRRSLKTGDFSLKNFLMPQPGQIGLIAGVITFVAVRLWLAHRWGTFYEGSDICEWSMTKKSIHFLPTAILTGLKGGLVIVGLAVALLLVRRKYFLLALAVCAVIPVLLATILVFDLSRSLFYAFPVLFIAAAVLARQCQTNECRRITFCALLGSALFPTCYVAPFDITLLNY